MHKEDYDSLALNTRLKIEVEPGRGRKSRIKARYNNDLIHADTLDLHDAAARAKLASALVGKACQMFGPGALAVEDVEQLLLAAVDRDPEEPGVYSACLDAALGGGAERPLESVDDPDRLARLFIESNFQSPDGPTLLSYQGKCYCWDGAAYSEALQDELDAKLAAWIKAEFDRYRMEKKKAGPRVTTALVGDVRLALMRKLIVPASRGMPCWIGDGPWPVGEVLVARNGLFHLPALAKGLVRQIPPTPLFFSTFAPEFEILARPDPPVFRFRVQRRVEESRDANGQVGQFVSECCRVDNPLARTPRDELYTAYKQWCFRKGHEYALSRASFGIALRAVVPGLGVIRPKVDGTRFRSYTGIAVNE